MSNNIIQAKNYKSTYSDNLPPKDGGTKPTESGIYYNYKLVKLDELDRRIEFRFEKPETNSYMTYSIWLTSAVPLQTEEEKLTFQNRVVAKIGKLLYLFVPDSIADDISANSLSAYAEKAIAVISAYKDSTTVNLGLIYNKDGKYTEVSSYGIEQYTKEGETRITFTEWEKKNRMTKSSGNGNGSGEGKKSGLSDDDLPF